MICVLCTRVRVIGGYFGYFCVCSVIPVQRGPHDGAEPSRAIVRGEVSLRQRPFHELDPCAISRVRPRSRCTFINIIMNRKHKDQAVSLKGWYCWYLLFF